MADISKININNGTKYNIKDTTARNGLTDRPTSFVGTRSEWNALPVATQVKYSLVNLIGEGVYKNNGTGLDDIAGKASKNFQGTIAEWNQLTTAEKKAYDHASIPDSIDGGVTFPANKVVMTGGGNVEDALDEVESGLTVRLSISVTLPATTDGRSSVQLDNVIPAGAKVVGYTINEVSTYSDAVCINAYFNTRTVRVTMVSNLDNVPQITCNLVVGITY